MIQRTHRSVVSAVLFAGILLCACGKKDDSAADAAAASASAPAAASATADTPDAAAATTAPPAPHPTAIKNESIDACCTALALVKKSGKDVASKRKAEAASAVCPGIAKLVRDGKTSRKDGLTQIKSALTGSSIPTECQ